ncbi:hypothetical protein CCHR01_10886 [Colletotrichum chrysophilum]|uniref:Uncharacterized protein n=1 Tax=Colletotrichum chrysophilum TaxID=1836956 RepID=A0AAD9EFK0_9PEZI|nr:hypothetical protein CCHR01_10886 [Colletotrichum chrysophilum]
MCSKSLTLAVTAALASSGTRDHSVHPRIVTSEPGMSNLSRCRIWLCFKLPRPLNCAVVVKAVELVVAQDKHHALEAVRLTADEGEVLLVVGQAAYVSSNQEVR